MNEGMYVENDLGNCVWVWTDKEWVRLSDTPFVCARDTICIADKNILLDETKYSGVLPKEFL